MIDKKDNSIKILIPKKFAEKHIGSLINELNDCLKSDSNYFYYFDFSQAEWIANQNLLLLSGVIKYIYNSGIKFKIKLLDYKQVNKRKVEQICELWYTWQFCNIFDKTEYDFTNYIENFSSNTLEKLCRSYDINLKNYISKQSYDLYGDQYSIIPFVSLNYIVNARFENTMNAQLKPVYDLNQVINDQLSSCKCEHPFINKTISAIITKELYDNFIDHFEKQKSLFNSSQNWAFMSISLRRALITDDQNLIKSNFQQEEISEAESFFFDKKNEKYKNENLIHFSFIDFGAGIVETLKEQYKKENQILNLDLFTQIDDNEVLKYAFKHNSSRNPILDKYEQVNKYIPRGLYDLLTIVKRYNGLLIVRSNYGKILYNFSETSKIKDSVIFFDKEKREYFPGTYLSIYIPAWHKNGAFDRSVIQPEYESLSIHDKPKKSQNINLFSIVSELSTDPELRYKQLIEKLSQKLLYEDQINRLTYINFFGVTDRSIIEKTIFYLIGSYEINQHNSIIIVYPPSEKIIDEINTEILDLDEDKVIQDFRINPIPVIYIETEKKEITLKWIGIFNEKDKQKLNDLLLEIHSLILSDFEDGYKTLGNTNAVDKFGNFSTRLPIAKTLINYYERFESVILENAIKEYNCEKTDGLYLCNGHYFQESFLQLTDILNSRKYGSIIPLFLLNKIRIHLKQHNSSIDLINDTIFIAVTASSHKILNSLIRHRNIDDANNIITKDNCLFLDSYLDFENELKDKIKPDTNYILICDLIATGNLTRRLDTLISEHSSKLVGVAVIVNSLDEKFETYNYFKTNFIDSNRFIDLYKKPIQKLKKENLSSRSNRDKLIRINPYTNIPITMPDVVTFNDSILLTNQEFLDCIFDNDIEIRFKLFNNLIHPYFFKTAEILKRENEKIKNQEYTYSIIYKIFEKLKEKQGYTDPKIIFYPKDSDIEYLEVEQLQIETKIFGIGGVRYFELERYNPGNGWKFPHTTDSFRNEIENESVLILDDGSCSGDSLYQMVNELSYYNPTAINVVSIIGRVEDHKREFFSKIKSIKTKITDKKTGEYKIENIDVHIYFGTYWYIPTFYQEINPYREEYNWLEQIIKIQNIPEQIRTYAKSIKNEITPKSDQELSFLPKETDNYNYKYFPKIEDRKIETSKEILKIRNEVGKIIGYRFYKENFDWFNDFVGRTENTNFLDKSINKDVEHLLMCLIYEPYVYKKIIQIIPEIKLLIYNFIESFIFKGIDINHLNYKWRKVDIVHLYFIAYFDYNLVNNLSLERFKKLLSFVQSENTNYILFKLLYYLPDHNNKNKEIFSKIRITIDSYLQTQNANKNVKLFRYFITSLLLVEDDFENNISFILDEYRKINDSQKHKEAITVNIENLLSYLDLLITSNDTNFLTSLQNDLKKLLELISRILSISYLYPKYFSKYIDFFENHPESLRMVHKRLMNLLGTTSNHFDWTNYYQLIKDFQSNFLSNTTIPYKIFTNTITENFTNILEEYGDQLRAKNFKVVINNFSQNKNLFFPIFIFKEIVFNEIFLNIERYADNKEQIEIIIFDNILELPHTHFEKGKIFISIKNTSKTALNKEGSLMGTYLINDLNEYPNDMFSYSNNKTEVEKDINKPFIQNLVFKSI